MIDNNIICYSAIQRVYRNAVIGLIRSKMLSLFPNDYAERLKQPFPDWEKVKAHATEIRKSGQLDAPLADDFDVLGVNNFYNLFEKYYKRFDIKNNSENQIDANSQKQSLLNWLKIIKNLRDPLCHPAEEEFTYNDTHLLLSSAQKALIHLHLNEAAERIEELIQEANKLEFGISNKREPLESILPPRESIVVDFIGRDAELEKLRDWFADQESRRWALAGDGGKGKSALAYNFAVEIKNIAPSPFEAVFWLSAKKRMYLEGRVVDIDEPDFHNLDTAITKLLGFYGWVNDIGNSVREKKSLLLNLLNTFPAFVIVDDIDSLDSENEDVIEFFSFTLPSTKSKVLFTSRRTIFGLGGNTTNVLGFKEEEAKKFIESKCQSMNLDCKLLDKKIVQRIVKITEGSPLYIEDLIRWASIGKSLSKSIELWQNRSGDEARKYALGRECDLLTENARKCLFAACVFPSAVTYDEIEKVTEFNSEIINSSLHELQNIFLVSKPSLIEDLQRFEVNLNTKSLVKKLYGNLVSYRQIEQRYRTIAKTAPEPNRREIAGVVKRATLLVREKDYKEARTLIIRALEEYKDNRDLIGMLGFIYKSWEPEKRFTDARDNFERAAKLESNNEEMYKHWCEMEVKEQDWNKIVEIADKGLKILPKSQLLQFYKGTAYISLGMEKKNSFFAEGAYKEFVHAKEILANALRISADNDTLRLRIYGKILMLCEMTDDITGVRHFLNKLKTENIYNLESHQEWLRINNRFTQNYL